MRKSRQVISSFSAGIIERKILSNLTRVLFTINSLAEVAGQTKIMSKQFYNYKQNIIQKNLLIMHFP